MFATNSTRMKRTLQNDEVQSCETKQPKLEVPADDHSNQKLEKENHEERSEQPLQISGIGADNETKREENDIEEVDTQQEELSSSVPSSSEDFTPRSDSSIPVQKREGEIEKVNTQQEELSSSVSSSSEGFTPTSDASIPVEEQQQDEIEQIARKAVTETQVRLSPGEYYFHYTPFSTMVRIRSDGFLKPSTPFYKDNIGIGIYVTSMDPFSNSSWELRRDLFKGGRSPITKSKLQCFFALRKTDVDAACAIVQQYPDRPKCVRLVPKNNLLSLKDVDHYSGHRSSGGDSD